MKRVQSGWGCLGLLLVAHAVSAAIVAGPFAAGGGGGVVNGQTLTFGTAGLVYELDAFLHAQNLDLNGVDDGTSARLSTHALPVGLAVTFSTNLSPDRTDLWLTYVVSNATADTFQDVRFFAFVDAEIDETANTFFNEYGTVTGAAGSGSRDGDPDLWKIDEPGFVRGTVLDELLMGSLPNANALPASAADDAAMGLGFALGDLRPGLAATVQVILSEDGSSTGSLALVHHDLAHASPDNLGVDAAGANPAAPDTLTLSGFASVLTGQYEYQQVTNALNWGIAWQLSRQTGTYFGTLTITNPVVNARQFTAPFHLALHDTTGEYRFMASTNRMDDGDGFLDLSAAVATYLAAHALGDVFDGGEVVQVTGIELYSRRRTVPAADLFEVWANGN